MELPLLVASFSSERCWRQFCEAHETLGRADCGLCVLVRFAFDSEESVVGVSDVYVYK